MFIHEHDISLKVVCTTILENFLLHEFFILSNPYEVKVNFRRENFEKVS